jgi:hypothetical protein
MTQVRAVIAHQGFVLDRAEVERRLADALPEPLGEHYVVVGGHRYPPKQVIGVVTGLDRADFNTHQARRLLSRLGFVVGRRSKGRSNEGGGGNTESQRPGPHGGKEADALRPYMGQWVAQRGLEVLVSAKEPQAVLAWLERHGQKADAMFRVPSDETDAAGTAPA